MPPSTHPAKQLTTLKNGGKKKKRRLSLEGKEREKNQSKLPRHLLYLFLTRKKVFFLCVWGGKRKPCKGLGNRLLFLKRFSGFLTPSFRFPFEGENKVSWGWKGKDRQKKDFASSIHSYCGRPQKENLAKKDAGLWKLFQQIKPSNLHALKILDTKPFFDNGPTSLSRAPNNWVQSYPRWVHSLILWDHPLPFPIKKRKKSVEW